MNPYTLSKECIYLKFIMLPHKFVDVSELCILQKDTANRCAW